MFTLKLPIISWEFNGKVYLQSNNVSSGMWRRVLWREINWRFGMTWCLLVPWIWRQLTPPKRRQILALENSFRLLKNGKPLTGWISMYCTVLYCNVYVLYCTVLYYTLLYCSVLYCTLLYCTVLYCTVLYCTLMSMYCTVLYCTVLYCTVLYFTVL